MFWGRVVVEQFGEWWISRSPLLYEAPGVRVEVPVDFFTDFASFPPCVRRVYDPTDARWSAAALVHDLLYERHTVARLEADRVFFAAMALPPAPAPPTPSYLRRLFYRGVRLGGARAYDSAPRRQAERLRMYQTMSAAIALTL